MNKPSILIVGGDKAVKNLTATTLGMYNYHCTQADKGEQGAPSATFQQPDVILLSLGFPDMDGVGVVLRVRSWTDAPITVISARSEGSDKIAALDAETDDYLIRPFSVGELLTGLRSTQKRLRYMQSLEEIQSSLFASDGLTIDYAAGYTCLDGEELHSTPCEYKLFYLLAHNVGEVLAHSYITREMWGTAWEGDVTSLRVFMTSLREKTERNPSQPRYIQTHVGVGYRMMKR